MSELGSAVPSTETLSNFVMRSGEGLREGAAQSQEELSKLMKEGERFRAIFEMSPFAIYSCDASGVIDGCNPRAIELWGRAPRPGDTDERFCGSYKLFLPDGTYMPHNECPMALAVSGKVAEVRDAEVIIERPDGSRVTVIVNIRQLKNQDGEITGAINCFYDITERQRLEEELKHSHKNLERVVEQRTAALRALSSKLMAAQDDERRRISRELHDGIGQYLAHVHMRLSLLKKSAPYTEDEILKELIEVVERCSAETRTISHLLHPPLLEELGLASAISWYSEEFAERSGIDVNLRMPPEIERLSDSLEILLFRILQESLTNVHRHSGTRSVDIRVAVEDDHVLLEVKDHGQGIPAELLEQFRSGAGGGMGLRSMRERISEAGGRLEIESNGDGAVIRATVPLPHEAAA